jgi:hypothetical protein
LGQGNPLGEAFIAFQKYVLELARRGVIVAVCSKNEEATARLPFSSHPDSSEDGISLIGVKPNFLVEAFAPGARFPPHTGN